jgi:hypothetical protein
MADSTCSSRQRRFPAWSFSDPGCAPVFREKKRGKNFFFISVTQYSVIACAILALLEIPLYCHSGETDWVVIGKTAIVSVSSFRA